MNKLITLFVFVFLAAWGIGLFIAFITGMGKATAPVTEQQSPNYLEEQRALAAQTEEQRKKLMADLQYKIKSQNLSHQLPSYRNF